MFRGLAAEGLYPNALPRVASPVVSRSKYSGREYGGAEWQIRECRASETKSHCVRGSFRLRLPRAGDRPQPAGQPFLSQYWSGTDGRQGHGGFGYSRQLRRPLFGRGRRRDRVTGVIKDMQGQVVSHVSGYAMDGLNSIVWPMRYDPPTPLRTERSESGSSYFRRFFSPMVLPGHYTIDLTYQGDTIPQRGGHGNDPIGNRLPTIYGRNGCRKNRNVRARSACSGAGTIGCSFPRAPRHKASEQRSFGPASAARIRRTSNNSVSPSRR